MKQRWTSIRRTEGKRTPVQIVGIFWPKKIKKIAAIVFFSLFYFLYKALPKYPSKGPDCLALNIEDRRYTPLHLLQKNPS
ncbi:MAG: hypothetical protein ACTSQ8_24565 [Candidatus Helarchaeota archaeon]